MFRFRKNSYQSASPSSVYDEVAVTTVDKNGVECVEFQRVDNSQIAAKLPAYSDYQLSKLLDANVPLQPVNAQVLNAFPSEDEISRTMDELERLDADKESDNTDKQSNKTE